jgi:CheY-like chemotaxis protein/tetratricopeptide (TPR) repeat protein
MKRVLVIDDDVQTCQVIDSILRDREIQLTFAHDGREGLDLFQSASADLVICDLFLPGVMGYDVAASIKAAGSRIPVLIMSGICKSPQDARELGIPVYGDDFVAKPIDVDSFQEKVFRLLTSGATAGPRGDAFGGALPKPPAHAVKEEWAAVLAGKIVELFAERRSGVLHLARGDLLVDVSFVNGFPVDVVVPFRRENVGLFLMQQGRLSESEYDQALRFMVERRRTLEEALLDLRFVAVTDLPGLLRAHKREAIISCFGWGFGRAEFTEGPPLSEATFQLNPSTLVLDGIGRGFPAPVLLRHFEERANQEIQPGPHFDKYFTLFAPLLYRTGIQTMLASGCTVAAFMARAGDEQENLLRALKAFEVLRVLEMRPPMATPAEDRQATGEAPPSRKEPALGDRTAAAGEARAQAAPEPEPRPTSPPADEARALWEELLALKDADHYQLLGVAQDAPVTAIQEAFLARLQRYRPERSDQPPDVTRLAREMLLKLAAAYGALGDPELRAIYDRRLRTASPAGAPALAPGDEPRPVAPARPKPIPPEAEQILGRGKTALEQRDFYRALQAFEEARRRWPDIPETHVFAGLARYCSNPKDPETMQTAVQEILQATEIDDACDLAYYHLGQIYQEQRLPSKARAMFSRAVGINPNNLLARRALEAMGGASA